MTSISGCVYIIKRQLHDGLDIRSSFAALTREIFSPLENKLHIFKPLCNIVYISILNPALQNWLS